MNPSCRGALRLWIATVVLSISLTLVTGDLAAAVSPLSKSDADFDRAVSALRRAGADAVELRKSPSTGVLRSIIAAPGASIRVDAASGTARDAALAFVAEHGAVLGLRGTADVTVLSEGQPDETGLSRVHMQQVVDGVPVAGSFVIVHLRAGAVTRVFASTSAEATSVRTTPRVPPDDAVGASRELAAKYLAAPDVTLSKPRLEILDRKLLDERRQGPPLLAWFVEATREDVREYIWIDALGGGVLLHFSQLAEAKSRQIYNGNNTFALPGTLMRSEGEAATGDTDADAAYEYSGDTYDYFFTQHGRDSWNGTGGVLKSTVHHCPDGGPCPYGNAFWNGTQMVYGDGYSAADDVDAHELTHAVTESSSGLLYYMQSGALNESMSDIFGETVDLLNGAGTDTVGVRWAMGEDVPGLGAIRNMMSPNLFNDPAKLTDFLFYCGTSDGGGVHTNSGVQNHAYALMVDGGTFNGKTVSALGTTKPAKVFYRALTNYFGPTTDFNDAYDALNASCTDLIGTAGITLANCQEVTDALQAVEMNMASPCNPNAPPIPQMCSQGSPNIIYSENFENTASMAWQTTTIQGTVNHWNQGAGTPPADVHWSYLPSEGGFSLWGYDWDRAANSYVRMMSPVAIPAGARMQFDHSVELELGYDGGFVEYSTDGTTWVSAQPLFAAGLLYGTISAGTIPAFTGVSYGYTETQLNLASLAGNNVYFRFRVTTDGSVGAFGWFIDRVRIYTCTSNAGPTNLVATATSGTSVSLTWDAFPGAGGYQVFRKAAGGTFVQIASPAANSYNDTAAVANKAYLYKVKAVVAAVPGADSNVDIATTVTFTDDPLGAGTVVKAVHLTQARTAVDAVRDLAGLTAGVYTDLVPAGVTTQMDHVNELRTQLSAALTILGITPAAYTDPVLSTAITVKAAHFDQIRNNLQ